MIETEQQRRWWFATHPEFSRSNKEISEHSEKNADESEIDPKKVDAWADEALEYERDPIVTELIKEAKFWFGTAFESKSPYERQALLSEDEHPNRDDRVVEAQNRGQSLGVLAGYGDRNDLDYGDAPRLPTTEELSQWPKQLVREFFGWLDAILQNNPLLIDPNALEGHHGLPKAFIKRFLDCGMRLDEFIMIMRASDHRLKAEGEGRGGIHTGEGRGGDWNTEWEKFFKDHPPEDSEERQQQIRDQFNEMVKKFELEGKYILSPKKPRRR